MAFIDILCVDIYNDSGAAIIGNAVGPRQGAASLLPDLVKGGLPNEYIRSFSTLFGYHRYLQPVYPGE